MKVHIDECDCDKCLYDKRILYCNEHGEWFFSEDSEEDVKSNCIESVLDNTIDKYIESYR